MISGPLVGVERSEAALGSFSWLAPSKYYQSVRFLLLHALLESQEMERRERKGLVQVLAWGKWKYFLSDPCLQGETLGSMGFYGTEGRTFMAGRVLFRVQSPVTFPLRVMLGRTFLLKAMTLFLQSHSWGWPRGHTHIKGWATQRLWEGLEKSLVSTWILLLC